jgi:hypothetical protein
MNLTRYCFNSLSIIPGQMILHIPSEKQEEVAGFTQRLNTSGLNGFSSNGTNKQPSEERRIGTPSNL